MTQTDFKNQVDNLMNILFGAGVASHATIIEQINYLVFLRSLSRKDDNAMILDSSAEKIFSGELKKYHWDNLLILNADELFNSLEEVFRKLPEITTNQTIKLLFRDAHVKIFDKPTLRRLVHEIEKMFSDLEKQATAGHTDIFGDMYEYLLSKLSQAGTLGSFRTPRHIIKFIVDVIDPKKGETILDPACGTAGFLVAALKHLEEKYTSEEFKKLDRYPMDLLSPNEQKYLRNYTFTGFDSDFDMFKFGLMNLYLHKLEHPNIKRQNTLVDTAGDRTKWDVILANPPFAGALDIDSVSEDLRMGTRATELLFLRYMIDHLSPSGRAGVIVPEGVVFNSTNAHKKIRQMLVEDAGLWCVVSLPAGIFNPYAGVKTSILFFDKSLKNKVKDILFVKIENDGFDLGATKKPIDKNDLPIALEEIDKWRKEGKVEGKNIKTINRKKIIDHNYNLNGDQYGNEIIKENTKWPIVKLDDICTFIGGFAFKSKDLIKEKKTNDYLPIIKIGNINKTGTLDINNSQYAKYQDDLKNFLIIKGDLLVAMTGATVGKVAYSKYNNLLLNQRVGIIRPNNQVLKQFLKYLLISNKFYKYCQSNAGGGAQGNISPSQIKDYQLPLPPLEIQKQLVEELDGYQKIIDGAKQVVENWKPSINIKQETGYENLENLADVISGQSPEGKYYNKNQEGLPFFQGKTEFTDYILGDPKVWTTKTTKVGEKGDILMSVRAPVGPVNMTNQKICIGRGLAAIKINDDTNKKFIFYFLKSIEKDIKGNGGAVFDSINKDQIKKIKIPVISMEDKNKIVNQIEKEKVIIDSLKNLIELYQEKTNQRIEEVWGE